VKGLAPYSRRVGRRATSWLRHLPSFLIIGGIRCGTTSLIRYLDRHPSVGISATKEVHFYDWYFHRGENWYRSWFPLKVMPGNNDMIAGVFLPTVLVQEGQLVAFTSMFDSGSRTANPSTRRVRTSSDMSISSCSATRFRLIRIPSGTRTGSGCGYRRAVRDIVSTD